MTEQHWLVSEDPVAMLRLCTGDAPKIVEGRECGHWPHASDRKLRLFACACVRQVWHLLTDERSRKAVEVAEWSADGEATADELAAASSAAWAAAWDPASYAASDAASYAACSASSSAKWSAASCAARDAQANLLRDIIGNPWRPATLLSWWEPGDCKVCGNRPDEYGELEHGRGCYTQREDGGGSSFSQRRQMPWLTPTVLAIAQSAYDERNENGSLDHVTLSILADALEDVGCSEDHTIITHLRSPGPHVRGCWALDLIRGNL